jgi:hypothetical protein
MQEGHAYLAGSRLCRCICNQNVARMDATGAEFMADHPDRIEAGATQIEEMSEIDHWFNIVLCRALEARCVVALIRCHDENIAGTFALMV